MVETKPVVVVSILFPVTHDCCCSASEKGFNAVAAAPLVKSTRRNTAAAVMGMADCAATEFASLVMRTFVPRVGTVGHETGEPASSAHTALVGTCWTLLFVATVTLIA